LEWGCRGFWRGERRHLMPLTTHPPFPSPKAGGENIFMPSLPRGK